LPLIMENDIGSIYIEDVVIQKIVGVSVVESYGVVKKGQKHSIEELLTFLGFDPSYKDIKITVNDSEIIVDIHIVLEYGIKIPTVCQNIIERVKYNLEVYIGSNIYYVNIFVEDIRTDSYL